MKTEKELELQIAHLLEQKEQIELELIQYGSEMLESLKPSKLIKETLSNLYFDENVKQDMLRVSVHLASNYLIEQFSSKSASVTGFLQKTILEKLSGAIINNRLK